MISILSIFGDSITNWWSEVYLLLQGGFTNEYLIIYIYEKLLSMEAVPTGIKRQMVGSVQERNHCLWASQLSPARAVIVSSKCCQEWQYLHL